MYALYDNKVFFGGDRIFVGKINRNKQMYKFKFLIAQYLDDFPSNKTTVHYRGGGNLSQDITNCLSLRSTLARSFN